MGQSIAPTQPAHYPSISNKRVIFFHTLMSEIVPDTIIGKLSLTPLFDTIIPTSAGNYSRQRGRRNYKFQANNSYVPFWSNSDCVIRHLTGTLVARDTLGAD